MPEKQPTDTQILRGFKSFEDGFNTYIAWMKAHPDEDAALTFHHEIDSMWAAHTAYRELATAAHARIEAKKGNQDAQ